MTENEIFQKVADCVGRTFHISPSTVSRATTSEDVNGWDSLAHGLLIVRVEKACNVRIPTDTAASLLTVGRLVDHVTMILNAQPNSGSGI